MEYTEISVSDFFNDVNVSFSRQQVVVMMADRLGEWEENENKTPKDPKLRKNWENRIKGLPFHVSGERYLIPISDIQQYFKNNPKPQKAMTQEEELIFLREKNKELEEKVKANVIGKPAKMKGEPLEEPKAETQTPEIPEEDKAIPSKASAEDIQKELKELVKNKQPEKQEKKTKK